LEVIKQWTDVHGLPLPPSFKTQVNGYPREVWLSTAGEELIEAYTISNMAHGTPLEVGEGEGACGAPGPFLLSVGISSSYRSARFFGIVPISSSADKPVKGSRRASPAAAEELVLEGEIFTDEPRRQQSPKPPPSNIGAIINHALRTAGLIKG
jgi:feruloyl esterase